MAGTGQKPREGAMEVRGKPSSSRERGEPTAQTVISRREKVPVRFGNAALTADFNEGRLVGCEGTCSQPTGARKRSKDLR